MKFALCCGCHCKRAIWVLAVIRVLITAFIVLFFFYLYLREQYGVKVLFGLSEWGHALNTFIFNFGLIYSSLNIFVSSLLYAGSFGEKKKCLPIYAFAEIIFSFCWVMLHFLKAKNDEGETYGVKLAVFIVILVLLILMISIVLYLETAGSAHLGGERGASKSAS